VNIYDLPIANFGELEDEAALKLILEVRSRRRLHISSRPVTRKTKSEPRASAKTKTEKRQLFNTPMGKMTKEQLLGLMEMLKSKERT